ncbi:hypothetical protein KC19_2G122100 [Ceratodon purpureus]|uniref:Uncharacterized protein n=1 Tax=Ceratodon purpureus TaxID=3225 RepID=A0A8T0IUN0_CERPU|nr:hypothetical protein KC19_2G122100 [Ceratodon purpureus]
MEARNHGAVKNQKSKITLPQNNIHEIGILPALHPNTPTAHHYSHHANRYAPDPPRPKAIKNSQAMQVLRHDHTHYNLHTNTKLTTFAQIANRPTRWPKGARTTYPNTTSTPARNEQREKSTRARARYRSGT